jgi:hypothetical protein
MSAELDHLFVCLSQGKQTDYPVAVPRDGTNALADAQSMYSLVLATRFMRLATTLVLWI